MVSPYLRISTAWIPVSPSSVGKSRSSAAGGPNRRVRLSRSADGLFELNRASGDGSVQDVGIQIGPVRPDDRAELRMDAHLRKALGVTEGSKDPFPTDELVEVDLTPEAVGESQVQPIPSERLHLHDIDKHHCHSKRVDGQQAFLGPGAPPVFAQLQALNAHDHLGVGCTVIAKDSLLLIAKKSSKNQITLPKRIVDLFPKCDYFFISAEDGQIVLRPVDENALAKVRRKLEELGIRESDVDGAIKWAR